MLGAAVGPAGDPPAQPRGPPAAAAGAGGRGPPAAARLGALVMGAALPDRIAVLPVANVWARGTEGYSHTRRLECVYRVGLALQALK